MTLSWGMCLPESCNAQDLEGLLNLGTCAFTLLSSVGRQSPRLFFTFSTGFEPSTCVTLMVKEDTCVTYLRDTSHEFAKVGVYFPYISCCTILLDSGN